MRIAILLSTGCAWKAREAAKAPSTSSCGTPWFTT